MVAGTARPDRDQDQVDADVAATRDRLVSAVEALVDRVHPQRIKQREVAGAKHFAQTELETLKLLVFNAAGELRTERLTRAGGGAAGFLGLLLVLRSLVARSRRPAGRRDRSGGSAAAGRSVPPSSTTDVGPGEVPSPAPKPSKRARSRPATDAAAEVTAAPAVRSARKRRAAAAPVGGNEVDARVRRARNKA